MLRLSIFRCQIRGLALLLRSSDELDDVREAGDEWRTNGCIKPCCEAIKKSPTAVVNSAEHWTHWRPSDDGELWQFTLEFLSATAGLTLF
jgi:hypothetical protein